LKGEAAQGVTVVLQPQVIGLQPIPDHAAQSLRARTDSSGRFHLTSIAAGRYSILAFAPGAIWADKTDAAGRPGKPLNISDGEDVENVELVLKAGGVITGRVNDAQGRSLIGERVILESVGLEGRPRPSRRVDTTDDRGVFRFYALREGRYRVRVGLGQGENLTPGGIRREVYSKTYYPGTPDDSRAELIEITEGLEATDIDIVVGETRRTYDITGRVVDESGQAVAGMLISRGAYRDGRLTSSGSTGEYSKADGEFRLIGLLPGKYSILAHSDGDGEYYADPVECDLGVEDLNGVEIKARRGASVSGMVLIEETNDSNALWPLPHFNLWINTRSNQPGQTPIAPTRAPEINADGSFQVRGLRPGTLNISLMMAPGVALARIERGGAPQSEELDVQSGENVTGVTVVIVRASLSLRGELRIDGPGLPLGSRLSIYARRTDLPESLPMSTASSDVDDRGRFIIDYLAPGEYEIRIGISFDPNLDSPDLRFVRAFSRATRKVTLSGDNQPPITLTIDLHSQEDPNRRYP
jgi:hypothetical protein